MRKTIASAPMSSINHSTNSNVQTSTTQDDIDNSKDLDGDSKSSDAADLSHVSNLNKFEPRGKNKRKVSTTYVNSLDSAKLFPEKVDKNITPRSNRHAFLMDSATKNMETYSLHQHNLSIGQVFLRGRGAPELSPTMFVEETA